MTANQQDTTKFCGGCGTPLQNGQQYCHVCGAANDWGADCVEPTTASASVEEELPQSESQSGQLMQQYDVDTEQDTAYVTPLAVGAPVDEKPAPAQAQHVQPTQEQSTEGNTEQSEATEDTELLCCTFQLPVQENQPCSICGSDLYRQEDYPAISHAHDSDRPLWMTVWGVPSRDEWKEVGKRALNFCFRVIGGLVLAALIMSIPHAVRSHNRQQQWEQRGTRGEQVMEEIRAAGIAQQAANDRARDRLATMGHPFMEDSHPWGSAQRVKWSDVSEYVGEIIEVYGEVKGASVSNNVRFIYIGADYPSSDRLTIVVARGEDVSLAALESAYLGKTIAVAGEVYLLNNAYYIQVRSLGWIQILE